MNTHPFFFLKEETDDFRCSWAVFVAKVVMSDFKFWERYSDYSWLSIDVLLRFIFETQEIVLESNLSSYEEQLEKLLRLEIDKFRNNPKSYELQYI